MSTAAPQLALVPRSSAAGWIALTPEQVMERTGWSRTTFFRRRGELIFRESQTLAANGRPQREYLESSLPAKAAPPQLALVSPAASLGPLFAHLPPQQEARIVLPDPEAQKQAQQRLDILQPIILYNDDPARYKALELPDGRKVTSKERMIEYVAVTNHQSPRTIKRWLKRFRGGNFAALADSIRKDKGQSRWFAAHREAAVVAAYLALGDIDRKDLRPHERPHRGQSNRYVLRYLAEHAAELGLDPRDLPSIETVRNFLSGLPAPLRLLALEGRRKYHDACAPYLRRRYDDIYANQVWVIDHMIHDAEVRNNIFAHAPIGAPVRLRLSCAEDYRSRKIVGATWTWNEDALSINACLLRGILQYGPPELIYADNGKAQRKAAKGARHGFAQGAVEEVLQLERSGFLSRAGIGVIHCIPRHPQSKGIERLFGTAHHFDAFFSTYTSGSPATRPDQTELAMMHHRRLLKRGQVSESKHPLASDFILACLAWIEQYNATPHSGEGMDGRSPNEVFAAELNPAQKPAPDATVLAGLMAEYERRIVDSCAVSLDKRRYTPRPEDRLGWAAMHHVNTQQILVAYDPADPDHAAALTLDGHFIAWLEAEQLLRFAPHDPVTQRQIGASMEIRHSLEKTDKSTLRAIARSARSRGARSAEEIAYSAILPPSSIAPVISHRKPRLKPDKSAVAPPSATDAAQTFLEGLRK